MTTVEYVATVCTSFVLFTMTVICVMFAGRSDLDWFFENRDGISIDKLENHENVQRFLHPKCKLTGCYEIGVLMYVYDLYCVHGPKWHVINIITPIIYESYLIRYLRPFDIRKHKNNTLPSVADIRIVFDIAKNKNSDSPPHHTRVPKHVLMYVVGFFHPKLYVTCTRLRDECKFQIFHFVHIVGQHGDNSFFHRFVSILFYFFPEKIV